MAIKSYSSVAASNISLFPEGMAPSDVNDGMRQVQADIRTWYVDAEWIDRGDSGISRASASSFKITGDVTAIYPTGRRLKCYDASTLYGIIASSSYSAPDTTINVTLDSGSLTTSLTSVAVGILMPTNKSFPSFNFDTVTVSGAAQFQDTVTISGAAVLSTTLDVKGATTLEDTLTVSGAAQFQDTVTISGAAALKTTLTVEGESTFSGTVTFKTTVTYESLSIGSTLTVSGAATLSSVDGSAIAGQTAMEAASATDLIVSPGNLVYHPAVSKCWARVEYSAGTPSATASFNVSSITDNAGGDGRLNLTTAMSSATFPASATNATSSLRNVFGGPVSTTGVRYVVDGGNDDAVGVMAWGDR